MTFQTQERQSSPPPQDNSIGQNSSSAALKRPLPIAIMIALLLLVAVGSYFLGRGSSPSPTPVETAENPPTEAAPTETKKGDKSANSISLGAKAANTANVKAAPVRYALFGQSLTVPGSVEVSPNRGARVTPPVSGKVLSLLAAPGDTVANGQRLAVLDSSEVAQAHAAVREADARVAEAQAQVQTAQAGVEQAQTKRTSAAAALQRQQELARTGAFSQPTVQAAQNELNTAQSELSQAQTDLQAQKVIVGRNERLFNAQVVAQAELQQSQVAQDQAQNRVSQATKRLTLAQQVLEREQRVFRGGLLNRQAIQTAEAEVRAAEGDVRQARKQEQAARTSLEGARTGLAAAKANLRAVEGNGHAEGGAGKISLYAPIAGTIATRGVTLGQAVERSSELFTVQNLQNVIVEADVPEASVSRVRVGAPVTVTVRAYPNARFSGVVQSIGSSVDPKTRALPVRCLVQNTNNVLKPEMFATVALATGRQTRTIVVPNAAIDEDGEQRFVYVKTGEGSYEKREVKLGRTNGTATEVLSGVKAGENVATDGIFILKSESKKDELKGDED